MLYIGIAPNPQFSKKDVTVLTLAIAPRVAGISCNVTCSFLSTTVSGWMGQPPWWPSACSRILSIWRPSSGETTLDPLRILGRIAHASMLLLEQTVFNNKKPWSVCWNFEQLRIFLCAPLSNNKKTSENASTCMLLKNYELNIVC